MRGVGGGEFLACLHSDRVPLGSWTPPRARGDPVHPGTGAGLGSRGCTRCAHPVFPLFLLPPPASGSPRSCSPTSRTATASQGTCSSASPQVSSHTAGTHLGHVHPMGLHPPSPGTPHQQQAACMAPAPHGTAPPRGSLHKAWAHRPPRGTPNPSCTPFPTAGCRHASLTPPCVLSLIPQATSSMTASTSSSTTSPARPGSTWCTTPW